MRKLFVLKAVVDFGWIVFCIPSILLLSVFSVYMFFDDSIFSEIKINSLTIDNPSLQIKLLILTAVVLVLFLFYCVFLFRKTIRFFQRGNPFDAYVINTYNKIGIILVITGISGALLTVVFWSIIKENIEVRLGISPTLFIIGLGLFFMILSETFKISKHAKEENDLTV